MLVWRNRFFSSFMKASLVISNISGCWCYYCLLQVFFPLACEVLLRIHWPPFDNCLTLDMLFFFFWNVLFDFDWKNWLEFVFMRNYLDQICLGTVIKLDVSIEYLEFFKATVFFNQLFFPFFSLLFSWCPIFHVIMCLMISHKPCRFFSHSFVLWIAS